MRHAMGGSKGGLDLQLQYVPLEILIQKPAPHLPRETIGTKRVQLLLEGGLSLCGIYGGKKVFRTPLPGRIFLDLRMHAKLTSDRRKGGRPNLMPPRLISKFGPETQSGTKNGYQ